MHFLFACETTREVRGCGCRAPRDSVQALSSDGSGLPERVVTRAFGACAAALMRGGFLRWEAVKAEVHRPYAHEEMFWRMAHFRRLGLRLLAPCLSACPAVAAGDESYVMRVWVAAMVEVEQVGGAAARTVHGGTLDHRSARSGFNCVCVCVHMHWRGKSAASSYSQAGDRWRPLRTIRRRGSAGAHAATVVRRARGHGGVRRQASGGGQRAGDGEHVAGPLRRRCVSIRFVGERCVGRARR